MADRHSPTPAAGQGPTILEVEVRAASPWRLRGRGSEDGTVRVSGGVVSRLLHAEGRPVLVRAWQPGKQRLKLRAEAVEPAAVAYPVAGGEAEVEPAGRDQLELAIERMRFALGVDDDLTELYGAFRGDPLLGPLLRRWPHFRPRRHPWAWEALVAAIAKQLIEVERAALIQRRMVRRWGPSLGEGRAIQRDVPVAATVAARAPAETQALDLSAGRAAALRRAAHEVASGRCDPAVPGDDRRLRAIPEIGPWTVQCLALFGRGEADSLPAGDLAYIKLVGRLAGLGRRATIPEVEEFYAPYAPFRGFAGCLTLFGLSRRISPRAVAGVKRRPDLTDS